MQYTWLRITQYVFTSLIVCCWLFIGFCYVSPPVTLAKETVGSGELNSGEPPVKPADWISFDTSLIGYWRMDEDAWTNNCFTATVSDSSVHANHGYACPNGTGPTGGAVGKIGKAGSFDG